MTQNFVTEICCGYRTVYLAVIAEWSACCASEYQKHIYIYISGQSQQQLRIRWTSYGSNQIKPAAVERWKTRATTSKFRCQISDYFWLVEKVTAMEIHLHSAGKCVQPHHSFIVRNLVISDWSRKWRSIV